MGAEEDSPESAGQPIELKPIQLEALEKTHRIKVSYPISTTYIDIDGIAKLVESPPLELQKPKELVLTCWHLLQYLQDQGQGRVKLASKEQGSWEEVQRDTDGVRESTFGLLSLVVERVTNDIQPLEALRSCIERGKPLPRSYLNQISQTIEVWLDIQITEYATSTLPPDHDILDIPDRITWAFLVYQKIAEQGCYRPIEFATTRLERYKVEEFGTPDDKAKKDSHYRRSELYEGLLKIALAGLTGHVGQPKVCTLKNLQDTEWVEREAKSLRSFKFSATGEKDTRNPDLSLDIPALAGQLVEDHAFGLLRVMESFSILDVPLHFLKRDHEEGTEPLPLNCDQVSAALRYIDDRDLVKTITSTHRDYLETFVTTMLAFTEHFPASFREWRDGTFLVDRSLTFLILTLPRYFKAEHANLVFTLLDKLAEANHLEPIAQLLLEQRSFRAETHLQTRLHIGRRLAETEEMISLAIAEGCIIGEGLIRMAARDEEARKSLAQTIELFAPRVLALLREWRRDPDRMFPESSLEDSIWALASYFPQEQGNVIFTMLRCLIQNNTNEKDEGIVLGLLDRFLAKQKRGNSYNPLQEQLLEKVLEYSMRILRGRLELLGVSNWDSRSRWETRVFDPLRKLFELAPQLRDQALLLINNLITNYGRVLQSQPEQRRSHIYH